MKYEREIFKRKEGIQKLQPSKKYEDFNWVEVRPGVWRYIEKDEKV